MLYQLLALLDVLLQSSLLPDFFHMGVTVKLGWYLRLLHYSREELVGRTGCCQTPVVVKALDLLPFRKSQQYDCKWYIPLTDLSFQMVDESEAVPNIPLVPDEELDAMKIKISQIKNDIQREKVKELSSPWQCRLRVCAQMRCWCSSPRAAQCGEPGCSRLLSRGL